MCVGTIVSSPLLRPTARNSKPDARFLQAQGRAVVSRISADRNIPDVFFPTQPKAVEYSPRGPEARSSLQSPSATPRDRGPNLSHPRTAYARRETSESRWPEQLRLPGGGMHERPYSRPG